MLIPTSSGGNVGVMIKVQVVNVGDASKNGRCSTAQCQLPIEAAAANGFGHTSTVSLEDVSGDDCASHRTGSPVNWPQAEIGDADGFTYNGSPMSAGFPNPNMGSLGSVPELPACDQDVEDTSAAEVDDESRTSVSVDTCMLTESARARLGTDVTTAYPVRNGFIQYKVPYDDGGADMRLSVRSAPTVLGSRRWSGSDLPSLHSLPESVRASVRSEDFWHSQDYWGASRGSGIRTSSVPVTPDGIGYEQRYEQWATGPPMSGVGSYSRVRSGSVGRRNTGARSQERRSWADEQWSSHDNWASNFFSPSSGHFPASRSASADTQNDGSPSTDVFSPQTPSGLWTTGPCAELRATKAEAHSLRVDLEDSRAETRALRYELDSAREQLRQEAADADRRCEEVMTSLEAHLRFELGLAEARWRAESQREARATQDARAAIEVVDHSDTRHGGPNSPAREAIIAPVAAVPKPSSQTGPSSIQQDVEVETFKIGWDHKKARRLFYKGPEPRRPVCSLADFLVERLPPHLPRRCSAAHTAKEFELTLEWVPEDDSVSAEDMVGVIQRTIKDVIEVTLERLDGTSGRNIVGGIKATRCPLMPGAAADAAAERASRAARKASMQSSTSAQLESSDVSPCKSPAQSSWTEASPRTLPSSPLASPPAGLAASPPTRSPVQSPKQSPTQSPKRLLAQLPPQPPAQTPTEVVPKSCNGAQSLQPPNLQQSPVRRMVPTASRPQTQTNRQLLHATPAVEALATASPSVAPPPKTSPVPTSKARAFSDATTAGSFRPSSSSSRGCATDADARSWTTDTSLEGRLIECADEHEQSELTMESLRREAAPLETPIAEHGSTATPLAEGREAKLQSGDAWCTSM